MENSFKTQYGYCHILSDKILLTTKANSGENIKQPFSMHVLLRHTLFLVLILWQFYFSYDSYKKGNNGFAIFSALLGALLVYLLIKNIKNSESEIEISSIKHILLKKGISGLTKTIIIIYYEEPNGTKKKKLIALPSIAMGGKAETEKAIALLQKENLLNPEDIK